jgi:hypothetical protein
MPASPLALQDEVAHAVIDRTLALCAKFPLATLLNALWNALGIIGPQAVKRTSDNIKSNILIQLPHREIVALLIVVRHTIRADSDIDAPHFNACDSFQLDLSFMPEPRRTEKHVPCLYFRALTHEFCTSFVSFLLFDGWTVAKVSAATTLGTRLAISVPASVPRFRQKPPA